jgi:hypothetical protein
MTDREHEQLLATATDRFERRLSEEIGAVRVTMVEQNSATRQEIAELRVEMSAQDAATRREVARDFADLRVEMSERFAESRVHTEARHRELLKWALVFWVGQAAAVAGIVSAFA